MDMPKTKPKIADIVIVKGNTLISNSIEWWTKGPSHAMLIWDWPMVISSDTDGLLPRDIREDENDYIILTPRDWYYVMDEQRYQIIEEIKPFIGKGYDFLGISNFIIGGDQSNDRKMFCSKGVTYAYDKVSRPLVSRIAAQFVTPRDILISPVLKVFFESNPYV